MYAFRVPRPPGIQRASSRVAFAAVVATAGLGLVVPSTWATTEYFVGASISPYNGFYGGQVVPYGSRQSLSRVWLDNQWNPSWARGGDIECLWAQNSPTGGTVYPGAATVKYAEDYWHTYGVAPPAFTGDYAGQEVCVQNSVSSHPYDGSTVRRGINFKSGLPNDGKIYYSTGWQEW